MNGICFLNAVFNIDDNVKYIINNSLTGKSYKLK